MAILATLADSTQVQRVLTNRVIAVQTGDALAVNGSVLSGAPASDADFAVLLDPACGIVMDGSQASGAADVDPTITMKPKGTGQGTIVSTTGNLLLSATAASSGVTFQTNHVAGGTSLDKIWDALSNLAPIYLGAGDFITLATGGVVNQLAVYGLPDALTTTVRANFRVPAFTTTANWTIKVLYAPDTINGAAPTGIRWSIQTATTAPGSVISATATTSVTDTIAALEAANTLHEFTLVSAFAPSAVGNIVTLRVDRVGGDAADTYTGGVNFIGLSLVPHISV